MMTITDFERIEWKRFATAAFNAGNYGVGYRMDWAANLPTGTRLDCATYDAFASAYRGWLVFNEFPEILPPLVNTYATDGKCHNAEPGTFGHECGKPAVWIGSKPNPDYAGGLFRSGFCSACRQHGTEAQGYDCWEPASVERVAA